MKSMTGFGTGDATLPEGRVVAEIRSVNQRFLDVRARVPRELGDLSLFAEQVARERLRRGRVELVLHGEGPLVPAAVLDKARARDAFRALSEIRDELAPGAELPLSLLAAVPDLFGAPSGAELARVRAAVKLAIERAIESMSAMCVHEGQALAEDLRTRSAHTRSLVAEVVAREAVARDGAKKRLRERVERLLAELESNPIQHPSGATPAARFDTEVTLLVERSDFTEEITRLGSHLDQFASLLGDQAEPVGRRLDFLLQEMLREANTLGAKAQDAELSHLVVSIKVELERLREQVQNIE